MNKKIFTIIGIIVLVIFTGSFWFLQKDKLGNESQEQKISFRSDLKIYNQDLEGENFVNIKKMTRLLIDNYYEWSIGEYKKQEQKINFEDNWELAEITSCAGYMQCNQYKIVKFGITKEELLDFMKNNNYNTTSLRFALLSAMKQDFPMIKKEQYEWNKVDDANDVGQNIFKLSTGDEIRVHQIRVLQIVEELDIK